MDAPVRLSGTRGAGVHERRRRILDDHPEWQPRTLSRWLDDCVQRYGDRPFILTNEITWTYRDVAARSRDLADGLHMLGVRRGDRVGMLMANYPDFVAIKFAIARTGATAVPFNYLYRRDELAYVLAQSECSVLVTMTSFAGLDQCAMLDDIVPGWDTEGFAERATDADGVPALRHVITLDTGGRAPGMSTVEWLAEVGRRNPGVARENAAPQDVGDILYTSGTTGSPKGVMVTHDAVLRTGFASAYTRAYEDGRRILFSLPCYHMFGYVEGLLSAMYVGGSVVMYPSFSAEQYLAGVQRHRATDLLCVPTMAVAMVEHPDRARYDLSSLTAILCGSAPAPIWLWHKVSEEFGVDEIVTGYGMTECGGAMTLTLPEDPLTLTSETAGAPKMAGPAGMPPHGRLTEYVALDPLTHEVLPAGEEGELASRGPTTMLGYWRKPAETAASTHNGLLLSGDLGRVRHDGYLEITGRSKELYKSGGELVMPREIEDLLAAHDAISQVFAVGVVDDRWGEIGVVVIVRTPGYDITAEEVVDICREHLARFKVPKRVVFLDPEDLPKTPTGKVQKFRLVGHVTENARTDNAIQTRK
ncbi:AMP-binding protein [Gordonia sp. L191]|uniref:class I adenylate-forming enzyme family protein n=1 Tax=Gordonia sp. L191 TaxID=2982699 RepID=UPI0024C0CF7B|nr:AMP-binding protein [Gordonia sp. L191]WHU47448.1 AMP-binding protein [Gordonia sp. L191]